MIPKNEMKRTMILKKGDKMKNLHAIDDFTLHNAYVVFFIKRLHFRFLLRVFDSL